MRGSQVAQVARSREAIAVRGARSTSAKADQASSLSQTSMMRTPSSVRSRGVQDEPVGQRALEHGREALVALPARGDVLDECERHVEGRRPVASV